MKNKKQLKEDVNSDLKDIIKKQDYITLRQWAESPAGTFCDDNGFSTLKITDDLYLTSEDLESLCEVKSANDLLMSCKKNNESMSDEQLDTPWLTSEDVFSIGDGTITEDEVRDFFYYIEDVDDDDFEDEFGCSRKHYNKLIKQIMKIYQEYKSKNESCKLKEDLTPEEEEKIRKSMKANYFTDKGANDYIKAKKMGLSNWYDPYAGNFGFDKKDYEANLDKINQWADEEDYYGIVTQPANIYAGDDYLEKSEDGKAYFLTSIWDGGYEDTEYQHIIRMPKKKYEECYVRESLKEAKKNNCTRLEILLSNAIDLLLNQGYSYDEVKRELGLSEEEKQLYIIDTYGAEEVEESCKGKKSKKQLKETWAGEDVIDDLVDRAKGYVDDGYDTADAIWQSIDEGLIYTKDIYDLVEHYGTIDTSTMIESFYDDLYQDIYDELEDYETEEDEDDYDDEYEESFKRNFKKNLNNKKELDEKYDGTYVSDNVSVTKEWSRGNNRTYMRVYLTIGNNTYKGTYSYINRPWERFDYQSALLDASRKAGIDVEQLRNLNSFNEVVDKIAELVSKKNEGLNEEKKLKESAYALMPRYDGRNSFYGKAVVEIQPDGTKILYSYNTPVCKIENDKVILGKARDKGYPYLVWKTSQTTLRHVKEFLKQEGFKADSVSQIEKDYEADFINNLDRY